MCVYERDALKLKNETSENDRLGRNKPAKTNVYINRDPILFGFRMWFMLI